MNYIIEGEEQPLKTGDFTPVDPDEKHHYRNLSPDKPFKMICGVPRSLSDNR
jgi:quercetin dioxygenase-like cupin family protein